MVSSVYPRRCLANSSEAGARKDAVAAPRRPSSALAVVIAQ
jgi:hypothetical protein